MVGSCFRAAELSARGPRCAAVPPLALGGCFGSGPCCCPAAGPGVASGSCPDLGLTRGAGSGLGAALFASAGDHPGFSFDSIPNQGVWPFGPGSEKDPKKAIFLYEHAGELPYSNLL